MQDQTEETRSIETEIGRIGSVKPPPAGFRERKWKRIYRETLARGYNPRQARAVANGFNTGDTPEEIQGTVASLETRRDVQPPVTAHPQPRSLELADVAPSRGPPTATESRQLMERVGALDTIKRIVAEAPALTDAQTRRISAVLTAGGQ